MTTKIMLPLVISVVSTMLVSMSPQASGETLLRWKLHEGQHMELDIRSESTATVTGEVAYRDKNAFFSFVAVNDVRGRKSFCLQR